ncbi:MAG: (E)-4-hydroxy-3-methylbut-2-enyl-diphosphate synthase [Parachlamydiaceae bacterium]|nr:(E)-4-hydroxy-3-methylbut-2-enyl-diphosphate synthase [Parachlamydiaceae bacterium]
MKYCESIFEMKRRPTRTVMVGNVGVGGANPIRLQSMTTSCTRDAAATIEQIIRLADSGCEIARVTVQGMKEADTCEEIKNGLIQRGYTIPLVADIHFFPPAALRVADFVDKVRINPGNFVDKRASFKVLEYDDASYQKELERIDEKFTPLVEKCKRLKRAMRIGTNHGSLSDRIMNRYGDTPQGMVESALEFAHVCRKNDYHDFMFSMKASNPKVMVQAYRLLVVEMYRLGWDYPLHLGVTEAGEGEDGRVKSAMGIGALLIDGIGDTIRVSLTEDPWYEIDPCQRLMKFAQGYAGQGVAPFIEKHRAIDNIKKRHVVMPKDIALHRDGSVFVGIDSKQIESPDFYRMIGCDVQLGKPKLKIDSADQLVLKDGISEPVKKRVEDLQIAGVGITTPGSCMGAMQLIGLSEASGAQRMQSAARRFSIPVGNDNGGKWAVVIEDEEPSQWEHLLAIKPAVVVLRPSTNRLFYARHFFEWLQENQLTMPVILNFRYAGSVDDLIISAATECGALLCDGLGDGIWLEGPFEPATLRALSFNILQAARMRAFKTDFISCPSCGRTLFDLQDVTKRIRARTSHLPGVKIAIMGCIVNGPGEMADADFGYVGSKPGMIDLYVGKTCVERDISFADADDRLIELIKKHGRWAEPVEAIA